MGLSKMKLSSTLLWKVREGELAKLFTLHCVDNVAFTLCSTLVR